MVDILTYYNEHPINLAAIERAILRSGRSIDDLNPEDLFEHDQDHYGGLSAVDALAEWSRINSRDSVLDLCSGLGGPARYLAYRYGCEVTGLDINKLRTIGALELTSWVNLDDKVFFVCGNATSMPFANSSFSKVISQEAFLHIDNKDALLSNCWRVLEPGGCLSYTDWVASPRLSEMETNILGKGMAAAFINNKSDYITLLKSAGFVDIDSKDVSDWWAEILRDRFKMYQDKKDETEKLFGSQRHQEFIEAYEVFVQLIEDGRLGGARFRAFRSA